MKWRVKNLTTGNYVSQPIDSYKASQLMDQLNQVGEIKYKAVQVELETKKLSPEPKPMSEDVKLAISHLGGISYAPGSNHSTFANVMLQRVSEKKYEISEKEEAYLWYVVYRYRRQVESARVIIAAKQNKVY